MTWRLARSLATLSDEIQERWPGTTIWDIGDEDHRDRPSDHNPNGDGVVCAIDVLGAGIAAHLWDHLAATRDPRVKYAIHDEQIISSTVAPWTPRDYDGANPHADHIHISVGRGPSGESSRPDLYDDDAPWGVGEDWFAMATKDELREVVREELERVTDGRDLGQDTRALRLGVRGVLDRLGVSTRHDPPGAYDV